MTLEKVLMLHTYFLTFPEQIILIVIVITVSYLVIIVISNVQDVQMVYIYSEE